MSLETIIYALFKPLLEELFKQFNLAGSRTINAVDAKTDDSFHDAWSQSIAARLHPVPTESGSIRASE